MHRIFRVLLIVLLAGVLFGLAVHHAATYPDNYPHPTAEQLAEDPTGWDGETVMLGGEVVGVDAAAQTVDIEIEHAGAIVTVVTAMGVTEEVEVGGHVQVYGELDHAATEMTVDEVVVVNRHAGDQTYKLGMSGLGVLLAAGLFLWYWRVDWRRLRFMPRRGDPDG